MNCLIAANRVLANLVVSDSVTIYYKSRYNFKMNFKVLASVFIAQTGTVLIICERVQ